MSLETTNYLDRVVKHYQNDVLSYMSKNMMGLFNPDINGYTLIFFIPPELSGLVTQQKDLYSDTNQVIYKGDPQTPQKLNSLSRLMTFAAIDFTPPQEQVNVDKISSRSGAIPYATEITTSEQVTVTYIDNMDLSIYKFHQVWIYYMWDIIEGKIKPADKFLKNQDSSDLYNAIDYAGAFYIVKYKPDLNSITYIGKCIGVFPQSLPSKELIGQRTANELTTLPFNYLCAAYRAEVVSEGHAGWIKNEFDLLVKTKYSLEAQEQSLLASAKDYNNLKDRYA